MAGNKFDNNGAGRDSALTRKCSESKCSFFSHAPLRHIRTFYRLTTSIKIHCWCHLSNRTERTRSHQELFQTQPFITAGRNHSLWNVATKCILPPCSHWRPSWHHFLETSLNHEHRRRSVFLKLSPNLDVFSWLSSRHINNIGNPQYNTMPAYADYYDSWTLFQKREVYTSLFSSLLRLVRCD